MVAKGVRIVTGQIVTGLFTLLGVALGLFGERWLRTWGPVEFKVAAWRPQQTTAHAGGGTTVHERWLEVMFLNQKDVPVTVLDMRVEFYKGGQPLEEWAHTRLEFIGAGSRREPVGPVNLTPHVAVPLVISIAPGRDDKIRALEEMDRAEFVAVMIGARDIRQELPEAWVRTSRNMHEHPTSDNTDRLERG